MKNVFAALILIVLGASFAVGQNERAPIVEKEFEYRDWTYKDVRGGSDQNLRKFADGKKLVMVLYFAGWCPNWKHDAPFVKRIYDKYHDYGFDIIGVGEYDTVEAIRKSLDSYELKFPAVTESELRTDKQKTLHYQYRRSAGDTRNWGSPWYIFLEPAKLSKGDVLTTKASVVNGELIESETERFIRQKLGLPDEAPKKLAGR